MKQIIFLLLISFSLSAQVKGVVLDSISGKPIAYVNIWVENENLGATSEENGTFLLDISEEKNIIFSALGYETKTLKTSIIEKVYLKKIVYEMKEIVLKASKKTKSIKKSKYKKNKINMYYGTANQPTIIARKIEQDEEIKIYPFLKEITFLSMSLIDKSKIILRFYEVDSEGKPGQDYLEKNIILEITKGKKNNKVDLSNFNIKIPDEGLFIAFEWMIIEENKYKYQYTKQEEDNKIKYEGITYEPHIGVVPLEKQTTWHYGDGKWFQRTKHNKDFKYTSQYNDKFGELAIELTLTN